MYVSLCNISIDKRIYLGIKYLLFINVNPSRSIHFKEDFKEFLNIITLTRDIHKSTYSVHICTYM